jgi:sialidase-1
LASFATENYRKTKYKQRILMNILRFALAGTFLAILSTSSPAAEKTVIKLDDATRETCVKVLRAGLHGDEFWPAIHAAEGLTLGGHGKEVIEFLTPKLATEKDDQHRCGLAREIVRAGDRSKAQIMLDILAGEDTHGHVHAAESLYKVAEIGDGKSMRKAFRQSKNIRLKLMAAAALGRCGNKKAMAYLRDMVGAKDPEQFRIAAWILGRIGDKSDIDSLRKHLPKDADPITRAYVNNSLATLGDPAGQKALGASLKSDDGPIRTYAATFAGDARLVGVAEDLKKQLDDSHLDARIRAAQALLVLSRPAAAAIDCSKKKKKKSE